MMKESGAGSLTTPCRDTRRVTRWIASFGIPYYHEKMFDTAFFPILKLCVDLYPC